MFLPKNCNLSLNHAIASQEQLAPHTYLYESIKFNMPASVVKWSEFLAT
jgi:hypothetical protein